MLEELQVPVPTIVGQHDRSQRRKTDDDAEAGDGPDDQEAANAQSILRRSSA
jgi:hypothetical protein